jgi:hypothetical protein
MRWNLLCRFINLYNQAILNSPKSSDLDERLAGLNAYFTKSIYENVCRSLFEKDKLIFSLVLTLGILRAKVSYLNVTVYANEKNFTCACVHVYCKGVSKHSVAFERAVS